MTTKSPKTTPQSSPIDNKENDQSSSNQPPAPPSTHISMAQKLEDFKHKRKLEKSSVTTTAKTSEKKSRATSSSTSSTPSSSSTTTPSVLVKAATIICEKASISRKAAAVLPSSILSTSTSPTSSTSSSSSSSSYTTAETSLEVANLHEEIAALKEKNQAADLVRADAIARLAGETTRRLIAEKHLLLAANQLNEANQQLHLSQSSCKALESEVVSIKGVIEEKSRNIAVLGKSNLEFEGRRRIMHEEIMTLKGNIRVFCRVRPQLKSSSSAATITTEETRKTITFPDDLESRLLTLSKHEPSSIPTSSSSSASSSSTSSAAQVKPYNFKMDKVFTPKASQADVFVEIEQLVQTTLDGHDVCIFAYGQSGSGKTFTMCGAEDGEGKGMIGRAVDRIFEVIGSRKELFNAAHGGECNGRETTKEEADEQHSPPPPAQDPSQFSFTTSYVEIYNEKIIDLITPSNPSSLQLKMSPTDQKLCIDGVSEVICLDRADVNGVFAKGGKNRKCKSTNVNEVSSRSHSVFMLKLHNVVTGHKSSLVMIDLAGSERISKSGVQGVELKETQAINKSLSSLGDVISALSQGDKHVPYRNSKLTYLLSGYLTGGKCAMIVNVSPEEGSAGESLNSLRFAEKAGGRVGAGAGVAGVKGGGGGGGKKVEKDKDKAEK